MSVIREQIRVLDDGLFVSATYLNRQLYSGLFSSLVDEIIAENKQIYITILGIDEAVIDGCVDASYKIREILEPTAEGAKHYKNLTTEEEKYEFYINNRERVCDAIAQLARCLYELYSDNQLRIMMHAAPTLIGRSDYTEKLSIFISQLIMFSNALSDDPIMSFDGSFVLDKNTKFSYWNEAGTEIKDRAAFDVLEQNDYIRDSGNADPVPGGYPAEVLEPVEPQYIENVPVLPDEALRPVAPEEVQHPGEAPIPVSAPIIPDGFIEEPVKPAELDNLTYILLIDDLNSGRLTRRQEIDYGVQYTPTATLTKRLYSTDAVSVTFTDGNGGVISEVSVDKGTSCNFIGELPTKPEDISATYTFGAWVDADGNLFDLSEVNCDATLYPSFIPNYKEYEVEYNVNGAGKNLVLISVPDETLEYLPITHFADLAEESLAGILISAKNISLELSYLNVTMLKSAGVSSLDINLDTSIQGSYTCELIAVNSVGEIVDTSVRADVSIPCTDPTFAYRSSLTYVNGNETVYVNKSYSGTAVKYRASMNRSYSLTVKYIVSVSSNMSDIISAPNDSLPGQNVELTLNVPDGYTLDLYYVLESDSKTKYPIDGASFIMPFENIRIGGTLTQLEPPLYTVIFVSDGKEISNKQYEYGDTVRIPNAPTKLSDDEFSYSFVGWSPEVTTVTGDVTYVAQYERIPLPAKETEFPWFAVLFYTFITLLTFGAFALVVFVLDRKGIISFKNILLEIKQRLASLIGKDQLLNDSSSPEKSDVEQIDAEAESVSEDQETEQIVEDNGSDSAEE